MLHYSYLNFHYLHQKILARAEGRVDFSCFEFSVLRHVFVFQRYYPSNDNEVQK